MMYSKTVLNTILKHQHVFKKPMHLVNQVQTNNLTHSVCIIILLKMLENIVKNAMFQLLKLSAII